MIINYYLTEIVYDYRNNVLIINEVIRKDKSLQQIYGIWIVIPNKIRGEWVKLLK